jgi:hypothetical protein
MAHPDQVLTTLARSVIWTTAFTSSTKSRSGWLPGASRSPQDHHKTTLDVRGPLRSRFR